MREPAFLAARLLAARTGIQAPAAANRRHVLMWLSAAGVLAGSAGCRPQRPPAGQPVAAGSRVVALGDSLTFGTGAAPDAAYPAQLAALTGWDVLNAGVPGHTAAQAVARLPALLSEHRPALVIVSVGGNDFLRRLDEADTEAQVRRAVTLSREAGAQVLLVGVPRPTVAAAMGVGLSDHPLFARVAEDTRVPLHSGGWARVLGQERLRSDAIHANAEGYRVFAEDLVSTLRASALLR